MAMNTWVVPWLIVIGLVVTVVVTAVAIATMVSAIKPRTRIQYSGRLVQPGRGTRVVCALCGYDTRGDFYLPVFTPGQPDMFVHSMGCGPVLNGQQPAIEPTHRKLPDGTYQRIEDQ